MLTSLAGIYSLNEEQLLGLERIGKKSAQSLLAEIENSKKLPLNRVLFALGIRFVGERTAQLLAEAFGSMDALMAASVEELESVNEVGPRVAQAIQEFFAEEKNRQLIEKLRHAGLTFTAEKKKKSAKLEGLTLYLPAPWRICRAKTRSPGLKRPGAAYPARSARRPTTWWLAKTQDRSSIKLRN